jgi:hypothetical protein
VRFYLERVCNIEQDEHAERPDAAFNSADIGAVQSNVVGKPLLTEPRFLPKLTNTGADLLETAILCGLPRGTWHIAIVRGRCRSTNGLSTTTINADHRRAGSELDRTIRG